MGGRQSIKNKEDDEDDKFDYDKKEKVFIAMNSTQGIAHDSSQKYLNMRSSITPTHALYITEKLKLAIFETGIPIKQVKQIWHLFIKQLGRSAQGIFIQGIYNIFDISNTDIESLYLERLCLLMEKHNDYLVTFDEFFSIVSQFAIMNNSELIDFVFNMFDSDGNKFISKGDIIKVCEMKKNNVFLFPQNIVRAVEIFETRRGDKIEEFYLMALNIPYLVFPAERLQDIIRQKLGGRSFWLKIQCSIQLHQKTKEITNLENRINEKQKENDKQKFKQQLNNFYKLIAKTSKDPPTRKLAIYSQVRRKRKRGSDGFIQFQLPKWSTQYSVAERLRFREMVKDEFKVPYSSGIISYPRVSHSFTNENFNFEIPKQEISKKMSIKRASTSKLLLLRRSSTLIPASEIKKKIDII